MPSCCMGGPAYGGKFNYLLSLNAWFLRRGSCLRAFCSTRLVHLSLCSPGGHRRISDCGSPGVDAIRVSAYEAAVVELVSAR